MKHQKFSKLKSKYEKQKIGVSSRKAHIKEQQQLLAVELNQCKETKSELDGMKMPLNPVASHHAIMRYAERVLKLINPQEIAEKILTPEIVEMIKEGGDGHYINDNFKVVVKNNVVTTILI